MRNDYFIYLEKNMYLLATREDNVPANKVAARVSLTKDQLNTIVQSPWESYQEWLAHYFDIGQKLVTA